MSEEKEHGKRIYLLNQGFCEENPQYCQKIVSNYHCKRQYAKDRASQSKTSSCEKGVEEAYIKDLRIKKPLEF